MPVYVDRTCHVHMLLSHILGCLQNEDRRPKTKDQRLKTEDRRPKTEDRRPKNEDPNFFARIRHGQLKNQAKAFLGANRYENNGDIRFVEKTP